MWGWLLHSIVTSVSAIPLTPQRLYLMAVKVRNALGSGTAVATTISNSIHAAVVAGVNAMASQWKNITVAARKMVLGWLLDGVEENNRVLIEGLLIAREL